MSTLRVLINGRSSTLRVLINGRSAMLMAAPPEVVRV